MTTEEIKEFCKLQHMATVCEVLMLQMPIAYTSETAYQLERDMKIKSIHEDVINKMLSKIKRIGADVIGATFSDNNIMKDPKNRFTLDEQRQATKEVIGESLTLEEVFEKYSKGV